MTKTKKQKITKKRKTLLMLSLVIFTLFVGIGVIYAAGGSSTTFGGFFDRQHSAANTAPNSYYGLKFKTQLGTSISAPLIDATNHRIYHGTYSTGKVFAIDNTDGHTGQIIWQTYVGPVSVSGLSYDGNYIYVGTDESHFEVLSASDGRIVVDQLTDGPIITSPLLANGKTFIATKSGTAYAFGQGADSTLYWTAHFTGQLTGSPITDGSAVYLPIDNDDAGGMLKLDINDGTLLAKAQSIYGIPGSPGWLGNGSIYAVDKRGVMYKFNPDTM